MIVYSLVESFSETMKARNSRGAKTVKVSVWFPPWLWIPRLTSWGQEAVALILCFVQHLPISFHLFPFLSVVIQQLKEHWVVILMNYIKFQDLFAINEYKLPLFSLFTNETEKQFVCQEKASRWPTLKSRDPIKKKKTDSTGCLDST